MIMGHSFSPESITATKLHCMAAIMDKAENINWAGTVKALFMQKHGKFSMNANNQVTLEKKFRNLNKVFVLLMDKMRGVS